MPRPRAKTPESPTYDVHPGVAMVKKWADELPAKTGRTLDQWAKFINNSGIEARKDRIAFLKDKHELGTSTAWQIVMYAEDKHTWDGEPEFYLAQAVKYVEDQYAGPKASLRPILDALIAAARELGKEVKICPCKTMVPFYRDRVFAEVKPATKTRIEFSFALVDVPFGGILQPNRRADEKDRLKHPVHAVSGHGLSGE